MVSDYILIVASEVNSSLLILKPKMSSFYSTMVVIR